jgi:hypothetical protein
MYFYLVAFILIAVFMIKYQLKMRLLHIDLYSYKKYDFSYRKPTSHGIPSNVDRPVYNIIPEA